MISDDDDHDDDDDADDDDDDDDDYNAHQIQAFYQPAAYQIPF